MRRSFIAIIGFLLVFLSGQWSWAEQSLEQVTVNGNYDLNESEKSNTEWAEKISMGGFVIHFRHAQREQWNDVIAFDAYELASGIDASKSSFSRATCLTDQGKEEAKLLGKIMKLSYVKFSKIISSPSRRARQTALLAFGRINKIENALLHRSAVPKIQHEEFDIKLKTLIIKTRLKTGKNVALVGHVDTLVFGKNSILDNQEGVEPLGVEDRDPTGFVVLEVVGNQIFPRHVFKSMKEFSLASLLLPVKKP